MGCGKQVVSRRELARDRWVGCGPGLVYHTLLHPGCRPSLSAGTIYQIANCILQGASVCQATPLDHARRERYVGGGTLSVSQTASRSSSKPTQPARAEPKLHASISTNIKTLHLLSCFHQYVILLSFITPPPMGSFTFITAFASKFGQCLSVILFFTLRQRLVIIITILRAIYTKRHSIMVPYPIRI